MSPMIYVAITAAIVISILVVCFVAYLIDKKFFSCFNTAAVIRQDPKAVAIVAVGVLYTFAQLVGDILTAFMGVPK